MKRIIIISLICLTASLSMAKDYLIVVVKIDSTEHDINIVQNEMMRPNVDPQCVITNGPVWRKKGPPDALYYIVHIDVIGRNFPFQADNATAWINSHSGEFDDPQNVVVLKKFDSKKWSPEEIEE